MHYKFTFVILLLFLTGCAAKGHRAGKEVDEAELKMEREIAFQEALKKFRHRQIIVIDAGHGGDDFGAHSESKPKMHEKDLTLTMAKMVERYLKYQGYTVFMTRGDDTFIPLKKRSLFANEQKATLFVSLHFNSAQNRKAHGVEVFFYQGKNNENRAERSQKLADLVLKQMVTNTQIKSRGVKNGNFSVIRETAMPAILVESGFLTNDEEMEKLRNVNYLQTLALSVAQGVYEYLNISQVLVAQ